VGSLERFLAPGTQFWLQPAPKSPKQISNIRRDKERPHSPGKSPQKRVELKISRVGSQDLRTGHEEEKPSSSFYRWLGFSRGAIHVNALAAAAAQITAPIAAATPKAGSNAGADDAITGPIRAIATNPPVRATALFRPDAAPV
jgi:hypothetical protein